MSDNGRWLAFASKFGTPEEDELGFIEPPRVVPTGIPSLDAYLVDGMAPGVHVLMAQPGAGKSALALQCEVLLRPLRERRDRYRLLLEWVGAAGPRRRAGRWAIPVHG